MGLSLQNNINGGDENICEILHLNVNDKNGANNNE
jgi:hypothetical protein